MSLIRPRSVNITISDKFIQNIMAKVSTARFMEKDRIIQNPDKFIFTFKKTEVEENEQKFDKGKFRNEEFLFQNTTMIPFEKKTLEYVEGDYVPFLITEDAYKMVQSQFSINQMEKRLRNLSGFDFNHVCILNDFCLSAFKGGLSIVEDGNFDDEHIVVKVHFFARNLFEFHLKERNLTKTMKKKICKFCLEFLFPSFKYLNLEKAKKEAKDEEKRGGKKTKRKRRGSDYERPKLSYNGRMRSESSLREFKCRKKLSLYDKEWYFEKPDMGFSFKDRVLIEASEKNRRKWELERKEEQNLIKILEKPYFGIEDTPKTNDTSEKKNSKKAEIEKSKLEDILTFYGSPFALSMLLLHGKFKKEILDFSKDKRAWAVKRGVRTCSVELNIKKIVKMSKGENGKVGKWYCYQLFYKEDLAFESCFEDDEVASEMFFVNLIKFTLPKECSNN